ncbi:hypothetical protein Tco_0623210 [Tanacetum coccineum]
MGEGRQTKGHPEFLSRDNNLLSVFRSEDGTEGPMIIEAENMASYVHRHDMDGRTCVPNKVLYEQCFVSSGGPKIEAEMIPIYHITHRIMIEKPLADRHKSLLVKNSDEEHSTPHG